MSCFYIGGVDLGEEACDESPQYTLNVTAVLGDTQHRHRTNLLSGSSKNLGGTDPVMQTKSSVLWL